MIEQQRGQRSRRSRPSDLQKRFRRKRQQLWKRSRSKPVRKLDSETRETSIVIPVLTDEAAEESESTGAEDGEEKEPLELTQMVTEEGAVVDVNADQAHPAEKDRTTLQKIIKRVSLQSGTISEEQN